MLAVVACSAILGLSELAASRDSSVFSQTQFTTLHMLLQIAIIFVSFSIFWVRWLTKDQSRDTQSMFIASVFMSVGTLHVLHTLSYEGMPTIFESEEHDQSTFFGTIANLVTSAGLAGATLFQTGRRYEHAGPWENLLLFSALTAIVIVLGVYYIDSMPALLSSGQGVTNERRVIEATAIVLLLYAAIAFYRKASGPERTVFLLLSGAAVFGVFQQFAFVMYRDIYDVFSLTAHLFEVVSFGLVFAALFRSAVVAPREKLIKAEAELEKRKREAEAATMRAHTYLDFVGHDVANMVTPIMVKAGMISMDKTASRDVISLSTSIQEQVRKISSFINNVQLLSRSEMAFVRALEVLDLRAILPRLEKELHARYPDRHIEVTRVMDDNAKLEFRGGGVAEDVIGEVLDNAVKHSGSDPVAITIRASLSGGPLTGVFVQVDVEDNGPGMSDEMKHNLGIAAFDSSRRFRRGIVSSLPLAALALEQLGGRMLISDRVKGDHTKGTRITLLFPVAQLNNRVRRRRSVE